jgi:hypothetical protein
MHMKRLFLALLVVFLLEVAPAKALEPTPSLRTSPGEVAPTPEMWFYQQYMQQYMDPKMAVRKNAEMRADQRERRLESMRWFGQSNSRPRANVDPINNDYAPGWSSNNSWYPERWTGTGQSAIILNSAASPAR